MSIVVAVAENGVIGNRGDLPWRLSGDLQRFKKLTIGHALLMGRRTYESIGRPLPGRTTIVLTTKADYAPNASEVLVAHTLDEALRLVTRTDMDQREAFVVGGAEIYRLTLPHCARLYKTVVHARPAGDTYFPEVDFGKWRLIEERNHPPDAKNDYGCTWQLWERKDEVR